MNVLKNCEQDKKNHWFYLTNENGIFNPWDTLTSFFFELFFSIAFYRINKMNNCLLK